MKPLLHLMAALLAPFIYEFRLEFVFFRLPLDVFFYYNTHFDALQDKTRLAWCVSFLFFNSTPISCTPTLSPFYTRRYNFWMDRDGPHPLTFLFPPATLCSETHMVGNGEFFTDTAFCANSGKINQHKSVNPSIRQSVNPSIRQSVSKMKIRPTNAGHKQFCNMQHPFTGAGVLHFLAPFMWLGFVFNVVAHAYNILMDTRGFFKSYRRMVLKSLVLARGHGAAVIIADKLCYSDWKVT